MITAKFDMPKLERSVKKYAKFLGETTAQAVIRWSIQACREMARETQVWGQAGTRKKQLGSIEKGILTTVLVVESLRSVGRTYRATNQGKVYHVPADKVLADASAVNQWVESHRTGSHGYTRKLPVEERRVCTQQVFKAAMKQRAMSAGMAKGGWIGAGNDIAKKQKGAEKMTIGVNFLKYAQKHSGFGSSIAPQSGFFPKSKLTNKVRHSGDRHVLAGGAFEKASAFGLKKTIAWYRKTLKAQDKKTS